MGKRGTAECSLDKISVVESKWEGKGCIHSYVFSFVQRYMQKFWFRLICAAKAEDHTPGLKVQSQVRSGT